jgi:predicted peptidase
MSGDYEIGQHARTFEREVRKVVRLDYLLYLPAEYSDDGEPWPLMLFLHGAGERGSDLDLVAKHGPPKLIREGREFPCIVVSPQCPTDQWWAGEVDALSALLDELTADLNVDADRVYLTGLSMGGFGTWALAIREPDRFAALVPVCGGGDRFRASQISHTPAWVFHGAKDPVVPLEKSEEMVNALKAGGGEPRFTVYPEAEHDSWTETYENDELYEWLLAQSKG